MPPEIRTRATLRSAEFGFLGVVVYTRVHTPRRCGAPRRAGVLVLSALVSRPLRTSCAMVGNALPFRTSEERPAARRSAGATAGRPSYGPGGIPASATPAEPSDVHKCPAGVAQLFTQLRFEPGH